DNDKDREYGSWIFPFFIPPQPRPGLISRLLHAAEDEPLMHALDDALPGRVKERWKPFGLVAWDGDPVDDFEGWADLKAGVHDLVDPATMSPGSEAGLEVGNIPHLAARYFSFKIASGIRTVSLQNASPYESIPGIKADPHASVQAIVNTTGSSKPEEWT